MRISTPSLTHADTHMLSYPHTRTCTMKMLMLRFIGMPVRVQSSSHLCVCKSQVVLGACHFPSFPLHTLKLMWPILDLS